MTTTAIANDRMEGGYKPMPLLLSIPLLLICLGGGGFIIHWYVHSGALVKETSILGAVPPDGKTRYLTPNDAKNPTAWTGHTDMAEADFKLDKGTMTVTRMSYQSMQRGARWPGFLPDETRKILDGANAASRERMILNKSLPADIEKELQTQIQKSDSAIALSDADKAKLVAGLNAFISASGDDKVASEIKVLSDIDEIARAYEAVVINNAQAQVEAIKKFLTPEQFAALPGMSGNGNGNGRGGWGGPGGQGRNPQPRK